MNSYIRQTPVPADQMHSFLKDKQAWENAIAMYQGPDPLDHWYNYVCWYENHGHGDPENKFRETLERCLTQYEHSDYYKQDPRMVRLWLKYIDMQANPLEFYKVLYQRGVGRQVAAFYVSWAAYYESVHALKEAESVYNLSFQEKAQPYDELSHAYNKFVYVRSAAAAAAVAAQHKSTQLQQSQLPQQHLQVHYQHQQQQQQQHEMHIHEHGHGPSQGQQPAQTQNYSHQVSFQQLQQQQLPLQQQQHSHIQSPMLQQQPQHQQLYQQQASYQHLIQQHPQQLNQQHLHPQLLQHHHPQQVQQHVSNEQINGLTVSAANYEHVCTVAPAANSSASVPFEQQLPAASASMGMEQYQRDQTGLAAAQDTAIETPIDGIRLPRNFSSYCRNNFETWTPALFLEEPPDPCRRCHYPKELVYPTNSATEYSPEEIRARSYAAFFEQSRRQEQHQEMQVLQAAVNNSVQVEQIPEIGNIQQQQQSQMYVDQTGHVQQVYELNGVENGNASALEREDDEDYVDGEERENQEAEEGAEEEEEEAEDDESEPNETSYLQVAAKTTRTEAAAVVNTVDDLEEQIEASTIRFSQNKTIKIKFKKERPQDGVALNGSNYSAYTIESICQQEIASPPLEQEPAARRNGHGFHPYNLGHTSTPKTSSKRHKTKLKRVNKFQVQTVACSSSNSSSAAENGVAGGGTSSTSEKMRGNNIATVHNATFNDNANYSFSSAVALENSNCSLSSAVGRLNFRETTAVNTTYTSGVVADISTYQENSYFATQHDSEAKERRLQKSLETIKCHLAKEAIDPFNSELCKAFLTKLNFPGADDEAHTNYKIVQTPLPKIANTRTLNLPDGVYFSIDKEVGRGSYGSVYKATDGNTGAVVALKFQKPPNTWEIYICDQVLKRIQSPNVLPGLMDISTAIIAPNASLIATEFSPYGSLLDINNKIRQATCKVMHESLVMHFSVQICNIIQHLHMHKIIHADIKPDNFLLMRIPSTDLHFPSLRLIDFGCAIDMTLFPDSDDTKFRKVIQTDGFTCIEMQEGRPWSYETDLFCIAGTVHVMLMGEYMQLQKRGGTWDIKQKLPRYLKKHVWTHFFHDMLNIKASKLPDLKEMRGIFSEEVAKMDSELQSQIRTLSNILHRR